MRVLRSPKLQEYVTIVSFGSVDADALNATVRGVPPDDGEAVKPATGNSLSEPTTTVCKAVVDRPPESVTVSRIVYRPSGVRVRAILPPSGRRRPCPPSEDQRGGETRSPC